jgi:hypothetical protein
MSAIVPRDIARKLEQRWSARARQDESFHAKTDRLKRDSTPRVEGVQPAAVEGDDADSAPLPPGLPINSD